MNVNEVSSPSRNTGVALRPPGVESPSDIERSGSPRIDPDKGQPPAVQAVRQASATRSDPIPLFVSMLDRMLFHPLTHNRSPDPSAASSLRTIASRSPSLGPLAAAVDSLVAASRDMGSINDRAHALMNAITNKTGMELHEASSFNSIVHELKSWLGAFDNLHRSLRGRAPSNAARDAQQLAVKVLRISLVARHMFLGLHLQSTIDPPAHALVDAIARHDAPAAAAALGKALVHVPQLRERQVVDVDLTALLCRGGQAEDEHCSVNKLAVSAGRDCMILAAMCWEMINSPVVGDILKCKADSRAVEAAKWAVQKVNQFSSAVYHVLDAAPGALTSKLLYQMAGAFDAHLSDIRRLIADVSPAFTSSHPMTELNDLLHFSMGRLRELALETAARIRIPDGAASPTVVEEAVALYLGSIHLSPHGDGPRPMTQEEALFKARTNSAQRAQSALLASEEAEQVTPVSARAGRKSKAARAASRAAQASKAVAAPAASASAETGSAPPPRWSDEEVRTRVRDVLGLAEACLEAVRSEVGSANVPRSLKYIDFKFDEARRCLSELTANLQSQGHHDAARTLRERHDALSTQEGPLREEQARKLLIRAPSLQHFQNVKHLVSVTMGRNRVGLADISETGWLRRPGEYIDEIVLTLRGSPVPIEQVEGEMAHQNKVVVHVHRAPGEERPLLAHFKRWNERMGGAGAYRSRIDDLHIVDELTRRAVGAYFGPT